MPHCGPDAHPKEFFSKLAAYAPVDAYSIFEKEL
jgi:hypothetical protein